jgi:peptidoglycan hydrolase-like protein with peptidoglycan-binding domain
LTVIFNWYKRLGAIAKEGENMKWLLNIALTVFISMSVVFTQQSQSSTTQTNQAQNTQKTEKKRSPVFRATKDQIIQAQKNLQVAETGKLDEATRAAIKKYQSENGLRATGTLNRATLEKMGIPLTDKQKEIPINPNQYASGKGDSEKRPRGPVFRATKEQIEKAQEILTNTGYFKGAKTGKLDKDTREALRKYQEANGLKRTGTLNPDTLQKMGIELTEKQKEMLNKKKASQ